MKQIDVNPHKLESNGIILNIKLKYFEFNEDCFFHIWTDLRYSVNNKTIPLTYHIEDSILYSCNYKKF